MCNNFFYSFYYIQQKTFDNFLLKLIGKFHELRKIEKSVVRNCAFQIMIKFLFYYTIFKYIYWSNTLAMMNHV